MSSIVLVTTGEFNVEGVATMDSLKGVDELTTDCLVFNSSTDDDLVLALELSRLSDSVKKVIYIGKDISPLHYCLFMGVDADIYDSEDYLTDKETLMFLVDSYKTTGMTLKSPDSDVGILAKAIATLSSRDFDNIQQHLSNTFWLKTLNTAVESVELAFRKSSQVNSDVVAMVKEAGLLVDNLTSEQSNLSHELMSLRELLNDMQKLPRANTPFHYPTYNVPYTVQNVMYVRGYSPCRYLNSFILAYQDYLKMHKQRTCKVLFVLPKLKSLMKKYEHIPRLATDSISMFDFDLSPFYVTFEPKKMVLDSFFSQQNIGLFIVVDLTYSDVLLSGTMVKTFGAVSGLSDVVTFGLDSRTTFMSIVGQADALTIQHIMNYVNGTEQVKKTNYYAKCSKLFESLDATLKIDRR